ncbi:hypothetical protein [Priestia megaterium]|uniref:hypothetical protein n=1 Tax=Priestia megaterium TaxID=1404 RepID=UPI0020792B13|nr:hypothetical protein [Priestia megaterium]USL25096.1 hypothetical protein LIT33_02285 [Priestia megaterium]
MTADLKVIEKFRAALRENDYRFLIARIAIFNLKDGVKNKMELYKKVNNVLLSQQLKTVSYSFIKKYV